MNSFLLFLGGFAFAFVFIIAVLGFMYWRIVCCEEQDERD